jgi:hypothetical protein
MKFDAREGSTGKGQPEEKNARAKRRRLGRICGRELLKSCGKFMRYETLRRQ